MNPYLLAEELERCGDQLVRQVVGVSDEALHWKPSPEGWSLLEILVHMVDEEQLDFRPRLQSLLEDPARPWSSIDPEGWVTEKRYNERDVASSLQSFRDQRAISVAWLRQLADAAWDHVYHLPQGKVRAGDLAVSWVAHDHLHIAQAARTRAQWWDQLTKYSIRYAAP